jgi:hypothetical protein
MHSTSSALILRSAGSVCGRLASPTHGANGRRSGLCQRIRARRTEPHDSHSLACRDGARRENAGPVPRRSTPGPAPLNTSAQSDGGVSEEGCCHPIRDLGSGPERAFPVAFLVASIRP